MYLSKQDRLKIVALVERAQCVVMFTGRIKGEEFSSIGVIRASDEQLVLMFTAMLKQYPDMIPSVEQAVKNNQHVNVAAFKKHSILHKILVLLKLKKNAK